MMQKRRFLYYWTCFDKRKVLRAGRTWASSIDALCARLGRVGFLPVEMRCSYWMYFYPPWWWQQWVRVQSRDRLSLVLVAFFCRNVEALMGGGLSFFSALQVCAATAHDARLCSAVANILVHINRGLSPGDAFAAESSQWPTVLIFVLCAAQGTGAFREALCHMAEAFEREIMYRRDIARATLLPAVTGLTAFCVLGWAAYLCAGQGIGNERFKGFSFCLDLLTEYGAQGVLVFFLIVYACLRAFRSTEKLRVIVDRLILQLPLIGPLIARSHEILFFTMLALLTRAQVPLVQALEAMHSLFANKYWQQTVEGLRGRLMCGQALAEAMEAAPRLCIPALFLATLSAATSASLFAAVCQNMAVLLIRERGLLMDRYVTLLQPALMALVGTAIVGFLYIIYQGFAQSLGSIGIM